MSRFLLAQYEPSHQPGIDAMMEDIARDYQEPISGPQSANLFEESRRTHRRYWVALDGDKVVGTVGLVLLVSPNAVLKRMMTHRATRGTGLAAMLLGTATDWGRTQGVQSVYFGTMAQFQAAQKFYAKQGAREVTTGELPSDMEVNPIDSLHYRMDLTEHNTTQKCEKPSTQNGPTGSSRCSDLLMGFRPLRRRR